MLLYLGEALACVPFCSASRSFCRFCRSACRSVSVAAADGSSEPVRRFSGGTTTVPFAALQKPTRLAATVSSCSSELLLM